MNELIHSFVNDNVTIAMLALLVLDFVLGVLDSFKQGTFSFSYVADFARNDVLGKVVPWFVLHSFAQVAGSQDIVIPGFDVSMLADGAGVVIAAQLVASVLNSVKGLGLTVLPAVIAGDDPASPAPPTTLPNVHE
ncbi:MAG TPA: hypothetical protein VF077_01095 [Nitrospiraceae bacterium]